MRTMQFHVLAIFATCKLKLAHLLVRFNHVARFIELHAVVFAETFDRRLLH
jgi:hypothetical protein